MNSTNTQSDFTYIEQLAKLLRSRGLVIWIVESVFIILINTATFFGNLLVLIAVIRNPDLRRTIPNMYIITLAVSDLLMSIMGISYSTAATTVGAWPLGHFLCQLQGFFVLLLCAVSLQTLALTAVNRYFCVTRTRAVYRRYFTMKSTKVTIVVLWGLAFLAPLPYVAAGQEFIFHPGKVFCTHNLASLMWGYGAFLVLFYIAIPLVLIIFCYTKVFICVRRHQANFRVHTSCTQQQNPQFHLSVEEINITWMLLAVVLGFALCWTPVLVIDVIDFVNQGWKLPRQAYMAYSCFGYSSTATNAVIYGVMNRAFRAEYSKILPLVKRIPSRVFTQRSNHGRNTGQSATVDYSNKEMKLTKFEAKNSNVY